MRADLAPGRRGAGRTTARAGHRGTAEGLPARGAGGARPLPAAARATRSCCSIRMQRAGAGALPRRVRVALPDDVVVDPAARLYGGEYLTMQLGYDRGRIPSSAPLEAPPLFSLDAVGRPRRRARAGRRGSRRCSARARRAGRRPTRACSGPGAGDLRRRAGTGAGPSPWARRSRSRVPAPRRATSRGRAGWSSTATRSSRTTSSSSTSATRTCS